VADNGKRNIDERLDALTMNLELLSHSIEAHDRQFEVTERKIDKLTDAITKLVAVTNQDATAIRTLARLAEAHESRIAGLEGAQG
jgi:chromosome segregation ATPase